MAMLAGEPPEDLMHRQKSTRLSLDAYAVHMVYALAILAVVLRLDVSTGARLRGNSKIKTCILTALILTWPFTPGAFTRAS